MSVARPLLILFAIAALPSAAAAQFVANPPPPSPHWGIAASIAPWQAGDQFKALYDARALDLSGADFRIGVTRGRTLGNEWALLYVRRRIAEGGTLNRRGAIFELRPDVRVTAFMAERYAAFGTIANRAQIGIVLGGGIGRAEGMVRQVAGGPDLAAADVLTLFAQEVKFQLMLRAELAAAFKLAPGTKLRISGGFAWPGTTVVTITGMYFFGDR